ncbi:head GIN domain-containing protein [Eudoraea sp.]|uniref:head GIN domain-containing protein n=1 Tax=Eudoraea sp. TaxID=1979955 RepID=UPI003C788043
MRRLFLITLTAITIASCSKDDYTGSGNTVSEFREVNLFTKVSSEGTFAVNITQGPTQSLEIIADDNIISRVKTRVSDGQLKIYLEDGNYRNIYLEANITVADLNGIKNEGTGDITVFELQSDGIMEIENIGSGNIAIAGYTDNLYIKNEGSGTINGAEFMAAIVEARIEGSGDCEVYCTESLNVNIEGSGNVYYKGSPTMIIDISGSGQVIPMN